MIVKVKGRQGSGEGVTVTMSYAELVRILCVLDAAERNYRGVPAEVSPMAGRAMITHISDIRDALEKYQ